MNTTNADTITRCEAAELAESRGRLHDASLYWRIEASTETDPERAEQCRRNAARCDQKLIEALR